MSQVKYNAGNSTNSITIQVFISTPGVTDSEVYENENGNSTELVKSSDATGVIKKSIIGIANSLKNSQIEIDTDIALDFIPNTEWQTCFDNLVIKYYLNGGTNGLQIFQCDANDKQKSTSGKTILVEKFIQLS